ncbi:hypothetical protein HY969_05015 [Candidatus Kaiserbacteria bacterium]|nr:hypothetical protein [Candidatus Kaiserbacteria bacterium]
MNSSPDKPSRRKFLTAAGAAVLAPHELLAQSPEKREYLDKFKFDTNVIRRAIRTPETEDFFKTRPPKEIIKRIIEQYRIEPDWALLADTEYDPKELKENIVLAGIKSAGGISEISLFSQEKPNVGVLSDADRLDITYGQIIPYGKKEAIMPGHIFDILVQVEGVEGFKDPQYDAAVARIPNVRFNPKSVAHFPPRLTTTDIHGSFVAIAGYRPDSELGRTGVKMYGGIAFEVTKPLYDYFEPIFEVPEEKKWLSTSLVVISKSSEGVPVEHFAKKNDPVRPVGGMSGGIAAMIGDDQVRDGYQRFGYLWGAAAFEHNGEAYTAYFLHGPEIMQRNIRRIKSSLLQR